MNIFKEIYKKWSEGVERGFSVFQWCLIGAMIIFAFQGNRFGLLFSLSICIFGYFEPIKKATKAKEKR